MVGHQGCTLKWGFERYVNLISNQWTIWPSGTKSLKGAAQWYN